MVAMLNLLYTATMLSLLMCVTFHPFSKGKRISEDLTTINIKQMSRARNHAGIKSTWSWNGHIWVQAENGRKATIDMFDDIDAAIDRSGRQRDP